MKASLLVLCFTLGTTFNVQARIMTYNQVKKMAKKVIEEGQFGLTEMKIHDVNNFCPKYSSLSLDEKEYFFAHLATEMTYYESGFDTENSFVENNGNISTGLFQISYRSIAGVYKRHGCQNIKIPEDLKDPKNNLNCGFGIISTLVRSSGYLANENIGGASLYWSTLRTPYPVHIKSIDKTVVVGKKNIIIADLRKKYPRCFR